MRDVDFILEYVRRLENCRLSSAQTCRLISQNESESNRLVHNLIREAQKSKVSKLVRN